MLPNEPFFRAACQADISRLVALDNSATPTPWSEQNFRDSLHSKDQCWILENNNAIIASGIVSLVMDEASLLNITVCPDYQGQGLGRKMLEFLMSESLRSGASVCFLEVRESNKAAIALYISSHFSQVGIRKNYYQLQGRGENALVMKREL